jgi:ATP-binding cassette subfamily F protein 2
MTALQVILADARKKVADMEAEAERLTEEEGPDSDVVQDIYSRLEDLDEKTFEVRAGTLLHGLGFNKEMAQKKNKRYVWWMAYESQSCESLIREAFFITLR